MTALTFAPRVLFLSADPALVRAQLDGREPQSHSESASSISGTIGRSASGWSLGRAMCIDSVSTPP